MYHWRYIFCSVSATTMCTLKIATIMSSNHAEIQQLLQQHHATFITISPISWTAKYMKQSLMH